MNEFENMTLKSLFAYLKIQDQGMFHAISFPLRPDQLP